MTLERLGGLATTPQIIAPSTQLAEYEPIDKATAVWRYADEVPFAWAVAIATDSLNMMLLLLVIFAVHLRGPPPGPEQDGPYTFSHALPIAEAAEPPRRMAPDRRTRRT